MILLLLLFFSIVQTIISKQVIAYYDSRVDYNILDIRAQYLTHVFYATTTLSQNCSIISLNPERDYLFPYPGLEEEKIKGKFGQLNVLLKRKFEHLKTVISIGGWEYCVYFSDCSANQENREAMAKSILDFILKFGFDGADIDWEFPVSGSPDGQKQTPQDRENYTLLLKQLKQTLGQKLLTAAISARINEIQNDYEMEKVHQYLDFINVMGYDFHNNQFWPTAHHSALYPDDWDLQQPDFRFSKYNCDTAIQQLLSQSVPAEKIIFGVPIYGKEWKNVPKQDFGLHFNNSASISTQGVIYNYSFILSQIANEGNTYFDDKAKASFIYQPYGSNPELGSFICYDNLKVLDFKLQYINNHHLGGIMFWELSLDSERDETSIIYNSFNGLKQSKRAFLVEKANSNEQALKLVQT